MKRQAAPALVAFYAGRAKAEVQPPAAGNPAPAPAPAAPDPDVELANNLRDKAMRARLRWRSPVWGSAGAPVGLYEVLKAAAEGRKDLMALRRAFELEQHRALTNGQAACDEINAYLNAVSQHDRVANDNGTWRKARTRVCAAEPALRAHRRPRERNRPRILGRPIDPPARARGLLPPELERALPHSLRVAHEGGELIFVWWQALSG